MSTRKVKADPERDARVQAGLDYVAQTLVEWQAARIVLAELEAAGHPDIVDAHGRTWTWWQGDLYKHDVMALPEVFVRDPAVGLPRIGLADDNPNYAGLCRVCRHEAVSA